MPKSANVTSVHLPYKKRKILNDPVYGFIRVHNELLFSLIEHPAFQRLRRIKQVGMSHLVYPGALHTRFHHALGAMHLMHLAISALREKGVEITAAEAEAAQVAILLHDIGHGPFSHSLEYTIVNDVHHEFISALLMERLNIEFSGQLGLAIEVFEGRHPKAFLHQLISGQLDMDRLDYLSRDSFYTGVSEGVVSNQRIIKMIDVHDGQLVVEQKGIYSIEKFIMARRLMYWQVYLHKTVVAAEKLLIHILRRAKYCARQGMQLFASPSLQYFLYKDVGRSDFESDPIVLDTFVKLDDFDIMGAIKVWQDCGDHVLSKLCLDLVNRRLPRVVLSKEPFSSEFLKEIKTRVLDLPHIDEDVLEYYMEVDEIVNHAYDPEAQAIYFIQKDGRLQEFAEATDNPTYYQNNAGIKKYVLYVPKEINLAGFKS